MSVEQMGTATAAEVLVVQTEREVSVDQPRHAKEIGKRALELDGFMVLEMAKSPYEHVRRELESKVVDQPDAIDAIIEAIERSSVRLDSDHRPLANLAFLGPTGVGKSETAKVLSKRMIEGESNLIKIDCSSFANGHEVMSLIGSPPSYVGHEQTPYFAKSNVEQPGTVVLFDEVEKGSEKLYNLMLQIMGDGLLRLNNGDLVSFRDTIVILTSNLGAKEMSAQLSPTRLGFTEKDRATDKDGLEKVARRSFTEFFTPEFTNRLNKMVVFHSLGEEALGKVLDVKLAEANEDYERQYGVRISLSEATKSELVSIAAEEPHLGARPLVRALENNVQTTFGRYNTSNVISEGTHIRVVHRNELSDPDVYASDSPFIFTAKADRTIRKQTPPLAIEAAAAHEQDIEPEPDEEIEE